MNKKIRFVFLYCCLIVLMFVQASGIKADERSELKKVKIYAAVNAGVEEASIGWSPAQKAVKYRILVSDTVKGGYKCVKTVKGSETGVSIPLSSEKGHYVKVRPVFKLSDGKKLAGKKSDAVYVRSFEKAPALTVDTVKKGNRIKWVPSAAYDGYMIYAAYDDTDDYTVIKTISKKTKKKFIDKYVEPGTPVSYRICGYYKKNKIKVAGPLSDPIQVSADGQIEDDDGNGQQDPVTPKEPSDGGTVSGNTVSGNTVSGNSVSGNAVSGNTVSGDSAVSGDTVSGNTYTESEVIKFNTRTVLLGIGTSVKITAQSTESDMKPVYRILDETVASVDEDGVITGIKAGSTKVVAEIDKDKASAMVTVTDCAVNGIDISKWQGDDVDFEKVKAGGVSFVIMRIAYHLTKDTRFEKYYEGATEAGLKRGVYCYSMAKSVAAARKEAENVIELLDGRELDYPIALDLEDESQVKGLSKETRTDMVLAFKNRIEAAGYSFVLYANLNWLKNYLDTDRFEDVNIWIARYRTQSYGHGYTGKGNVVMWQYASNGLVDGILDTKGRYISIDMDVCYTDEFPITYDPAYDPPAEDEETGDDGSSDTGNTDGTGDTDQTGDTGNAGNTDGTGDTGGTDQTGDTGNTDGTGDSGSTDQTGDTGNTGGTGDTGSTDQTGDTGNTGGTGDSGSTDQTGDTENADGTGDATAVDTGSVNDAENTGVTGEVTTESVAFFYIQQ